MSGYRDDLPAAVVEAERIVGNQTTGNLRNMIRALGLLPYLNTDQDLQRLAAAKVVLSHRSTR